MFCWGEDRARPTTFFYRYDKNGQLDYLGKAESDVTNSTIVYDFMLEYNTIIESKNINVG